LSSISQNSWSHPKKTESAKGIKQNHTESKRAFESKINASLFSDGNDDKKRFKLESSKDQ